MKKLFILLFAAVLISSVYGCSSGGETDDPASETSEISENSAESEETSSDSTLEAAPLIGDALSPDGKYEVKLTGRLDVPAMGIVPPETVDVFDTKSGKVMWQTDGSYIHNVSWSEDSRYLALAVTARVWCCITVIDTETWTAWEFALPDGSSLPNYWFLTEDADWCVWNGENNVNFTVDNNDGKNVSYSCDLTVKDGALSGIVKETK